MSCVARRQYVSHAAVHPDEASRDPRRMQVPVNAKLGGEVLDNPRERSFQAIGVERRKMHRDYPGQRRLRTFLAFEGVSDGKLKPAAFALDVPLLDGFSSK